MRSKTSWILALVLLGLVVVASICMVADPAVLAGRAPRIKVSPATTYITGPLRPDGSVDYLAALDARYSAEVTPDNNAVVVLYEVVGSRSISPQLRAKFFARLEMSEPAATFVRLGDFASNWKPKQPVALKSSADDADAVDNSSRPAAPNVEDLVEKAMRAPWTAEEYPGLAAWLEANAAPLARVIEASNRPKYYDTLTTDDDVLMMVLLPTLEEVRVVTWALTARALLWAKAGQIDEARADLMACHRWARLVSQGQWLVHSLVAGGIEDNAGRAEREIVNQLALTPEQLAAIQADLKSLVPLDPAVDQIAFGERLTALDGIIKISRQRAEILAYTRRPPKNTMLNRVRDRLAGAMVDWDDALTKMNDWFDRLEAAARQPTRANRKAALAALDAEFNGFVQARANSTFLDWLASGRAARSQAENQRVICVLELSPTALFRREDRVVTQQHLTQLTLALAVYRADHGNYPPRLADLVPRYLAEVPQDLLADADFRYMLPDNGGYVLYSVGMNGKDDGARSQESDPDGEFDDLVVRAPGKK